MASKAAEILATALEKNATKHEQELTDHLFAELEEIKRTVKAINDIPRPIFKLSMRFWKQWAIASQNAWRYSGSLSQKDWPVLARIIAEHVRKGTLPNNQMILDNFVRKNFTLPFGDLKKLFE